MYEDRPDLVSELLEGSGLDKRMESGSLTVRRSLQIAVEIAEGLAAAHSRRESSTATSSPGTSSSPPTATQKFSISGSPNSPTTTAGNGRIRVRYQDPQHPGRRHGRNPGLYVARAGRGRRDRPPFGYLLLWYFALRIGSRGAVPSSATFASDRLAILRDDPPPLYPRWPDPQPVDEIIMRRLEKNPDERFDWPPTWPGCRAAGAVPSGAMKAVRFNDRHGGALSRWRWSSSWPSPPEH